MIILSDPDTAMQMSVLEDARKKCEADNRSTPSAGGLTCPQTWDGLVCWRATPAGTVARVQCPSYVFGFDAAEVATKKCLENGTWFFSQSQNRTWTNYTRCTTDQYMHSENISIFENVDCKVFTSFWHYVLMANYCWILMEGLYLHSLVFLAFFTDSSSILRYVALGWGLPVLFIVPWVVVRATLDDTLCWTTNPRQDLFWIIRGPITASILVNFILFLNITRVLFAKLFASQTPQARKYRYRKWFKSTLVLVPLFGAHYAFLLGMSLAAAGDLLELVWLYVDQLFSSFQGFVVALLYCFLNGEVQTELRKLIQRWRCDQRGPGRNDKQLQHRHSLFTQSVTFLSRGRSSIQSLHSMDRTKSPSPNLASSGRPFDEEGTPASQRNGDMPWSTPEDNLIEKETCL
uniref:Adenylate cyclase-coupled calcitonin receptor n=1 Tax=Rhipicephalus zambeziensis TaxID=60191 RepID=A0A224YGZ0_9ACAR